MERLRQMSLKKAFFTIAFLHITAALLLLLSVVWGCVELRSRTAPQGEVIYLHSDRAFTAETKEPEAQAAFLSRILFLMQMVLPVFIYMAALFKAASLFYRLKIKEPLEVLTEGASRIMDSDLDFTIEAKSQDELGKLCTAFEAMRRTLLSNNRELWRQAEERRRLNAAFSHNLRNPVTVLKGSVKLAERSIAGGTADAGQLAVHLRRIGGCTGRIERYVERMGSIQKLEEIPVERKVTEWDSLTSELENVVHFVGLDSGKQIRFTAAACQQKVLVDKAILFQAAENLIANALRFAAHCIDVSCSAGDGKLRLSVEDDGCGFPEELVKNGIQPFQKGKEEEGHFGIGLYTCELLSRKHGGGITIGNSQRGASVLVTLSIR